jgi:[ribosomal protein S5]-alanine N-acetyltransferase
MGLPTLHTARLTLRPWELGDIDALHALSGALAGFCGLIHREADAPPELMYALAPEYWGQGLATEAARAVLAHGFEQLQSPRITAASDPPNAASVRVLERLGMRFTHRAALNGLDTVFYEIARPTATGTAPR